MAVRRRLFPGLIAIMALLMAGMVLSRAALAAEVPSIGQTVRDRLVLAGKQVPLPPGDWLVAGSGGDTVTMGRRQPVAEVQSLVLLHIDDDAVAAAIVVHTNSRSQSMGWGKTRLCGRTDLPLANIHYESDHDVSCSFVGPVVRDADPDVIAPVWRQARRLAETEGWRLPGTWLMAGYRIADLHDVLDVRYHFNPDLLAPGIEASAATAWSSSPWVPERLGEDAARGAVVAALIRWTGSVRDTLELGFRNRIPAATVIGMPMLDLRASPGAGTEPADETSYVQPDALSLSFWKTVTYRILASATDLGVNYLFTSDLALSSGITAAGFLAFSAVYFAHESMWNLFGITTTVREVEFPGIGRDGP